VHAQLEDGPQKGQTIEVDAVEGRPPATIDVADKQGGTSRYCLSELTQSGDTAVYSFLYAV